MTCLFLVTFLLWESFYILFGICGCTGFVIPLRTYHYLYYVTLTNPRCLEYDLLGTKWTFHFIGHKHTGKPLTVWYKTVSHQDIIGAKRGEIVTCLMIRKSICGPFYRPNRNPCKNNIVDTEV